MMWNGGCGMGAGVVLWIVISIAALALIVVGALLLARGLAGRRDQDRGSYTQGPPPGTFAPNSALQVLEERYARGDIDREEFLQRRQDLLGP